MSEYEKCKSDIVYFAEKFLDCTLAEWQRDLLRRFHKGEEFIFSRTGKGKKMVISAMNQYNKVFK
ncbi:hypothetical protein AF332_11570 [Sporosarcina globispora]|uniref:Uncharacterized protein n=1 Tax=Sporosarcina globispora TaxID=1459 RepID=A0A0M0GD96_SPOGL|nr:hypothetical protein [Sporosarcina globispora]KON87401.1 hypothetical protein AF332_11570 [Sporosarcina globispora]